MKNLHQKEIVPLIPSHSEPKTGAKKKKNTTAFYSSQSVDGQAKHTDTVMDLRVIAQ